MNCIKKYLETRVGNYSFYFEDLRSGYSYGYNENVSMTAAGCMKLPIAISLIKAVEDKRANFMDKIKVDSRPGEGTVVTMVKKLDTYYGI